MEFYTLNMYITVAKRNAAESLELGLLFHSEY